MPIGPGTRVGPYEVTALLGEGGMGKVWRAHHSGLKRDDALKVLPDAFAADPERLARFRREAQVLASLNHPNIAHVYGLEETSGVQALVMELVDGPTLADRIAGGPLPVDEAVAVARQIAEALEAAHEQGIVHRDLKPANVKVRSDGAVKVLDFGLAKALENPAEAGSHAHQHVDIPGHAQQHGDFPGHDQRRVAIPGLSQSPTLTTPAMTQAGMILGTAAYMSPEQAKGRAADKRSDVWAFGCVLFEMLTARRAFDGEDTSDTLASVLKSEPDWSALPTDVSPAIQKLLRRCLAKDRRQRIADLSAASFVLAESAALEAMPGARRASASGAHRPRWRLAAVAAAAVIGATALVGLGAWIRGSSAPERPVTRFWLDLPDQQVLTYQFRLVAISPDGTRVAYAANNRIYLRSVSQFDSHAVAGTEREGVLNPVFSPDGGSLAFYSLGDRTIRRVAVSGGAPVMICPLDAAPSGMAWDSSGIVFGAGVGGIRRCPGTGGRPEQLATVERDEQSSAPQILPGGDALIFTIAREQDGVERHDKARIVVQSLATGQRRTLIDGGSDARYLPTGHLLYALGGNMLAVPFDPARQMVTGGPVSVVEGVRRANGADSGVAHLDASNSGSLLYVPGPSRLETSEYSVATGDRNGIMTPLKTAPGAYVHARASRDGARLAVDTFDGKEANVWVYDLAGASAMRRLTFGGRNRFPVWSPEGQRVAFQSDREGDLAVFSQRIDGTEVRRLTKPDKSDAHLPESWSPDGRHISFSVLKGSEYSLWILSVADGKTDRFSDVRSREPIGSVFSPDGRWIAYHTLPAGVSPESASSGVFVEPLPATGARYQAPKVNRDFHPLWSRDATELFYVGSMVSGQLVNVQVTTRSGVTFGSPESIPFSLTGGRRASGPRAFDALPDGTFVGLVAGSDGDLSGAAQGAEIGVVLNWFEELKRLVPTK